MLVILGVANSLVLVTHAHKNYATQGILWHKKLSNKQSSKVICRFDRLRIAAHRKGQKPYE